MNSFCDVSVSSGKKSLKLHEEETPKFMVYNKPKQSSKEMSMDSVEIASVKPNNFQSNKRRNSFENFKVNRTDQIEMNMDINRQTL